MGLVHQRHWLMNSTKGLQGSRAWPQVLGPQRGALLSLSPPPRPRRHLCQSRVVWATWVRPVARAAMEGKTHGKMMENGWTMGDFWRFFGLTHKRLRDVYKMFVVDFEGASIFFCRSIRNFTLNYLLNLNSPVIHYFEQLWFCSLLHLTTFPRMRKQETIQTTPWFHSFTHPSVEFPRCFIGDGEMDEPETIYVSTWRACLQRDGVAGVHHDSSWC